MYSHLLMLLEKNFNHLKEKFGREEILVDLADWLKVRQNRPIFLSDKNDFFPDPPKLIPAKFY